jgi:DNA polymerase IV
MTPLQSLCRDCLTVWSGPGRCPACRSPRSLRHVELTRLGIAHVDCDAFYASVEKRDNPELADVPVIVGGGTRGVVTTACYLARTRGVRSAMPMFQARRLCPDAVIVRPRMSRYIAVSRQIRDLMVELTPLVEHLSLDEAFLDLSGTERLHRASPAVLLAGLQARIERELGLSVSVGLSHNKFLAKIASDLEKPRGFALIGREETQAVLARRPVGVIWGVGTCLRSALETAGIRTIADLQQRDRKFLIERFGAMGDRLWHLARGEDHRSVSAQHRLKSISNESTFERDTSDAAELESHLWRLSEKLSARAKERELVGQVITLKLKHADHRVVTRRHTMEIPTQLAHVIYEQSCFILHRSMGDFSFRLIGLALSKLQGAERSMLDQDLFEPQTNRRTEVEHLIDQIRARYGESMIAIGRSFCSNAPYRRDAETLGNKFR